MSYEFDRIVIILRIKRIQVNGEWQVVHLP